MHHWSGVFRLLLNILFEGRICPNINIAAFNLISLRRHAVAFVLPNFIEICGAKNFKIRNQIFKKKCIFKSVPCPTNHRGHIGAQLHSFCYRKEQTVALKFYKISLIWTAHSDHFRTLFSPHLKVWQIIVLLWNHLFEKFYIHAHLQSPY